MERHRTDRVKRPGEANFSRFSGELIRNLDRKLRTYQFHSANQGGERGDCGDLAGAGRHGYDTDKCLSHVDLRRSAILSMVSLEMPLAPIGSIGNSLPSRLFR